MDIFAFQNGFMALLALALLAVKIFAFASSALHTSESYEAAGKLTKWGWMLILGLAVVGQVLMHPIGLVNLALTIAALVYLADVRPALAGLRRR